MEDVIIRDGDQITISIEEYLQLQQDNKLMCIALIILTTILAITISILVINKLFK